MMTYDDVLALGELTAEEVEAIAAHEHIPTICAAELGTYLCYCENGIPMLRRMMLDDIKVARHHRDTAREERLRAALRHFIQSHPYHGRRSGA